MCESREGQHEEAGGGIKDPCTSWHLESFPLFNHLLQRLKRRVSVCVCVCVRVIVHRGRRGFHPILDGNYTWQVWWMFSLSCTLSSLPAGFMKRHQPTFGIGTRELEKKKPHDGNLEVGLGNWIGFLPFPWWAGLVMGYRTSTTGCGWFKVCTV